MKKRLILFILFVVLIIALTACKQEPAPEKEYKIGDIGPAGGIIFYDKGNKDGGWRYLEAAPADLRVVGGNPTVDADAEGYDAAPAGYLFGYYRKTADGSNLFVNGTTEYDGKDCTGAAIGTGKKNTDLLVNAMGDSAYAEYSGAKTRVDYAANLCLDLVYNEYDDWFLPSIDELNLMYTNLKEKGRGGFADSYYWSSSEYSNYASYAWEQGFGSGYQRSYSSYRDEYCGVRPVRAFMSADDVPVHEHTYSSAWTTDETYHWRTATCEHTDEISGKAEHSFTDWIVTKEATQSRKEIKTRSCSVCGYEESEEIPFIQIAEFLIGDIGPTGGYIFYDCDADNDTGNADGLISTEVGWRYLEAAPADLKVVDGVPTVDKTVNGYSDASDWYIFGYYRNSNSGSNLFVNGEIYHDVKECTGTAIGTGKINTRLLVDAMGNEAYSDYTGSFKTSYYASRLCDILRYTVKGITYVDWFLPSKDELNLMYVNLYENGIGGFANYYHYYWSSSEKSPNADYAWEQRFDIQDGSNRNSYNRVRPVRAF